MGIYKYDPLLMDAKQVAVYLALSRPAVYRMSEQGNLPAPLRFGTLLRWRKSDIEADAVFPGAGGRFWKRKGDDGIAEAALLAWYGAKVWGLTVGDGGV